MTIEFQLVAIGNPREPELGVILSLDNGLTLLYDTSSFAFQRELLLYSPCCGKQMRARESGLFCTGCGYERYPDLHNAACDLDQEGSLRLVASWFEHHGEVLEADTSAYDLISWLQRLRMRFACWTLEEEACLIPEEVLKARLLELGAVEWAPSYG